MGKPGTLYIVATPIGNLEDITLRALRVLKEVDLIAAEDTRRTRQLLSHYDIHRPLISYHAHSRMNRKESLVLELLRGKNVALVTDAGTPGISDPGEHLIRRSIEEGIPLVPIPGPAAIVAALSISGLPTHHFLFHGFLPQKSPARQQFLRSIKDRPETLLFYESPRRLRSFLEEARSILGERRVVVARELTKVYEEVVRGTASQVLEALGHREIKGEVTVVIEGCTRAEPPVAFSIQDALCRAVKDRGLTLKDATERVAAELGASKREVYRVSLSLKDVLETEGDSPLTGKGTGKTPQRAEAE